MSDDTPHAAAPGRPALGRRDFLKILSRSSVVGLVGVGALACGQTSTSRTPDAGSNSPDAGPDSGADAALDTGHPDVDPEQCLPTGSDIQGPFYEPGAPQRIQLASAEEPGERILIEGTVFEPDCQTPIEGALIDVWQADAEGNYHSGANYRLRAQILTDASGNYRIETIRPGHYLNAGAFRPAHIHFTITRPGFTPLTTQLYFAGDPYLAPDDSCGVCASDDPTLIMELSDGPEGFEKQGRFDIVLQR
ncbi:hypothetical protein DV096_16860 [Bradymonadaceae bacterium TMQ3]|uniref:Intradiol ring-cleavage dioxygenases domain-containing protein n=1 Tax=Lujinxingia sediminis TaxID=2480984 RepID=A0ABY0CP01_9DELT|nr:hypothetical protein [Lujinxingia sediminis]RDV36758.1 hypothetical protein DV096_16860 [Bradymonadaceae bacterium TMQ3]RVU41564.1 hypothetical protein EA187_18065 [Lujinxingia sediminis]TXC69380.1 hypothetical protein FRC91_17440 [Bradymonadales bacterium TMQ1]